MVLAPAPAVRLTVPWVSNNARMDSSEAPKLRFPTTGLAARTLCPAAAPTSGRCPPAADAPVRDPGKPARSFPDGGVTPGGGPPVFFGVPIIAIVGSGKVRKGGAETAPAIGPGQVRRRCRKRAP